MNKATAHTMIGKTGAFGFNYVIPAMSFMTSSTVDTCINYSVSVLAGAAKHLVCSVIYMLIIVSIILMCEEMNAVLVIFNIFNYGICARIDPLNLLANSLLCSAYSANCAVSTGNCQFSNFYGELINACVIRSDVVDPIETYSAEASICSDEILAAFKTCCPSIYIGVIVEYSRRICTIEQRCFTIDIVTEVDVLLLSIKDVIEAISDTCLFCIHSYCKSRIVCSCKVS